jgi:predicted N-formylglutamate amidohydrolase
MPDRRREPEAADLAAIRGAGASNVKQDARTRLLAADECDVVRTTNPAGNSPFLLIGDHAGNLVPRSLASLGLGETELQRHIAWDIGSAELGRALAAALDAVFIRQSYSRLVVDCNRHPSSPEAVPEVSDGCIIVGNLGLTSADRELRLAAIQAPYQAAIAAEIERREAVGQATVLVSLHSFTPVMQGVQRPWQIGVLHDGHNDGFARRLLAALQLRADLIVGDNEPYRMDATDYTVPLHAFGGELAYVELEVRQDLLLDEAGVQSWAGLLAGLMAELAP